MTEIKTIVAAALFLALGACAIPGSEYSQSSGTQIDQLALSQFQKGKTTYAQVVQALGQPTSSMTQADGSTIATYASHTRNSEVATMGILTGARGTGSSYTSTTFTFDAKGILKDYTSMATNSGAGR